MKEKKRHHSEVLITDFRITGFNISPFFSGNWVPILSTIILRTALSTHRVNIEIGLWTALGPCWVMSNKVLGHVVFTSKGLFATHTNLLDGSSASTKDYFTRILEVYKLSFIIYKKLKKTIKILNIQRFPCEFQSCGQNLTTVLKKILVLRLTFWLNFTCSPWHFWECPV